ncbi:MAG: class I SAM-dependent methyltransferase, partial [Candidatus Eremiobacteraeota bacterium]|nr:class I SAM-dependent methyltransferase [Candidatus Eremiobacteraeota bacterium]
PTRVERCRMALDFQGLFGRALPTVGPAAGARLGQVGERLLELGYERSQIDPLFVNTGLCFRELYKTPGYLKNCQELGGPLACLVPLFLLRTPQPRALVEEWLGPEHVQTMLDCNLLAVQDDKLDSLYDLHPCFGNVIVTDHLFVKFDGVIPNAVYYLGNDSYELARLTPRKKIRRALDLCTGSGVQATMAAHHTSMVIGVDLNPRATAVAAVNSVLNGVGEHCSFLLGDLYGPVARGGFDLITANPPFIPNPRNDLQWFRSGGESGEEVTQNIFAGLPQFLAPGGTLALVTEYPILKGSDVLERTRSWIDQKSGWGLALLAHHQYSREGYIHKQQPRTGDYEKDCREMERWLDLYDQLGIEAMASGVFLARRLEPDDEWLEQKAIRSGSDDLGLTVSHWLDSLTLFNSQAWLADWKSWTPRLVELKRVLFEHGSSVAVVEFPQPGWPDLDLDAQDGALLKNLLENPDTPAGQLVDEPFGLQRLGRHGLFC